MPGLVDRAEKYLKSRFSDEDTTVYLSTDLARAADGSSRRFPDFKLLKIAPAGGAGLLDLCLGGSVCKGC
jgi:hypothetical protein